MEFGKQPFNTRIDKVIDNFILISLVKYTLPSLEGQKKERRGRGNGKFSSHFIGEVHVTKP